MSGGAAPTGGGQAAASAGAWSFFQRRARAAADAAAALPPPDPQPGAGGVAGANRGSGPHRRSGPPAAVPGGAAAEGGPLQQNLFAVQPGAFGSYRRAVQDLLERTQQALRRAGMARNDPLAAVILLLNELQLRQADLATDLAWLLEHAGARQGEALGQALQRLDTLLGQTVSVGQAAMDNAVGRVQAAAAESIRQQRQMQHAYAESFETAARAAMAQWAGRRRWRSLLGALAALLLVLTAAVWAAVSYGRATGADEARTALHAAGNAFAAIIARDGDGTAQHWLSLMDWNDLAAAPTRCGTAPDGIGYRQVCTYTLWNGPSLPQPPPNPP